MLRAGKPLPPVTSLIPPPPSPTLHGEPFAEMLDFPQKIKEKNKKNKKREKIWLIWGNKSRDL